MTSLIPFRAHHVSEFEEQEAQAYLNEAAQGTLPARLELMSLGAFTLRKDGQTLGCGGLIEHWPGRVEAWLILPKELKHNLLFIVRVVKDVLESTKYRRVEAVVDKDFAAGHRLVRILGFRREAEEMRGYGITGKDATLYARVRS